MSGVPSEGSEASSDHSEAGSAVSGVVSDRSAARPEVAAMTSGLSEPAGDESDRVLESSAGAADGCCGSGRQV